MTLTMLLKLCLEKKIGEWLELRFKHQILDQARFVTPRITETYFFDAVCNVKKNLITRDKFPSTGFSDEDLQNLIDSTPQGVIYTISPSHPLSLEALPFIIDYANKYQMTLTLLTDPTISNADLERLKSKYPSLRTMESIELIYRGMFNHFPSTLLFKNHKLIGRPLLGARGPEEIDNAFRSLLNDPFPKTPRSEITSIQASPLFGSMRGPDHRYQIKRMFSFPKDMHVKYVRAIPNSDNVLIFETKTNKKVHVYNTISEQIERSYNNMTSPYMSSDGKFAVLMDESRHLIFQDLKQDLPFFNDTMPAWYPGISVINGPQGKTTYRLITRMMELKIQDYEIDFSKDMPQVTHVGEEHRVCTNYPANATPYISRFNGNMFTLIQPDNSRQIVKLMPDNTCEPIVNLGFWTWKATFSFDDSKISLTAVRINSLVEGPIKSFSKLFSGHSFIY